MKIAILGSGNIGATLGAKWAAAGHTVVFGVRDPNSAKAQAAGEHAATDTIPNAISFGEVVVFATPAGAVPEIVAANGEALNGKLVIDTTNQFGAPVLNHLATIAAAAPDATLFRAFNSLGWENFAEPVMDGVQIDLLYCGPDGTADALVEQLIVEVGLRPIRVGDLGQAPLVDAVGAIWGALVFGQGHGRRLAFKVLTPNDELRINAGER